MKDITRTESEDTMKKGLMLLLTTAMLLLCSCYTSNEPENASEYSGELSKAQEIADASDATQVLKDSGEISDFMMALDMEHWELGALPKTAELMGTFRFSQAKTVTFGDNAAEDAADGELYPVCQIFCYEDIPYIALEIAGISMTFKVSDTTMEYLAGYFGG